MPVATLADPLLANIEMPEPSLIGFQQFLSLRTAITCDAFAVVLSKHQFDVREFFFFIWKTANGSAPPPRRPCVSPFRATALQRMGAARALRALALKQKAPSVMSPSKGSQRRANAGGTSVGAGGRASSAATPAGTAPGSGAPAASSMWGMPLLGSALSSLASFVVGDAKDTVRRADTADTPYP